MVKAHAASHGAYATVLTPEKQPMFKSDLAMYVQANTLIGVALCYAKLLPIIIVKLLYYWLSNKSI